MNAGETKTATKKVNRYPGLRPFVRDDSSLFFGRNTEIIQLVDSIKVNKTVVLFGKSGLGKSSIVQAGVAPKLIAENFLPITIRLFVDQKQAPLKTINTEIGRQIKNNQSPDSSSDSEAELIGFFREWTSVKKPVLIFDQFEEFFYNPPHQREKTIEALASLLGQSFTITVKSEGKPDTREMQIDVSPRVVFLIRSDRYNMMNELAEKIPGLFNNRFELKPLLKAKAEQSIVLPAQISKSSNPEAEFKVARYKYNVKSLQIILNALSNNEEIESSQLQMLCQELEEIAEKDFEHLEAPQRIIAPGHFRGEAGIKEILNRFYWKQLEKLRNDAELTLEEADVVSIRRLIESELVRGGKRVIQSEETVRDFLESVKPGVGQVGEKNKVDAIIDKLLDLRLIREEYSHRGKVYEISHDTLLESIIKLRDIRIKLEKDKKIEEQQQLLEKEKKRADEESKLKGEAEAAKEKAQNAEKEVRVALDLAIEQEENANRSKQKALLSEKTAKRYLKIVLAALLVVVIFVVGFVIQSKSLKHLRQQASQIYARIFYLNAIRAYEDANHALAFNLANAADSVLERNGELVDSLLAKWNLNEYSGLRVEASADGSIAGCLYRNRILQLFHVTDTVRKNGKSVMIDNADEFKLSADGTTLEVSDTIKKQFRFYRLHTAKNLTIDTAMIWAVASPKKYEVNQDEYFTKNYFATIIDSALHVYFIADKSDTSLPYQKSALAGSGYANNNSVFLFRPGKSFYGVEEIALSIHKPLRPRTIGNYVATNQKFQMVFDKKTGFVSKVLPDTIVHLFKISKSSLNFAVRYVGEYNDHYLLATEKTYLLLPKSGLKRGADGIIPVNEKSFSRRSLGEMVDNSTAASYFIKVDSLLKVVRNDSIHAEKIKGLDSLDYYNDYYRYELSADNVHIYCYSSFGNSGIISVIPSPAFTRSDAVQFYVVQTLGRKEFFYSSNGNGLRSLSSKRLDKNYWYNFYEPLDTFSKKIYGLE